MKNLDEARPREVTCSSIHLVHGDICLKFVLSSCVTGSVIGEVLLSDVKAWLKRNDYQVSSRDKLYQLVKGR